MNRSRPPWRKPTMRERAADVRRWKGWGYVLAAVSAVGVAAVILREAILEALKVR